MHTIDPVTPVCQRLSKLSHRVTSIMCAMQHNSVRSIICSSRNSAHHCVKRNSLCPSAILESRHLPLREARQKRLSVVHVCIWECNNRRVNRIWERHICTVLIEKSCFDVTAMICSNDPSAGSPTETLLRLLLPLSDKVHQTFHKDVVRQLPAVQVIHRITQSVGATGGVYKGQGRNRHELMTRAY